MNLISLREKKKKLEYLDISITIHVLISYQGKIVANNTSKLVLLFYG